jgi:hypothetical protein
MPVADSCRNIEENPMTGMREKGGRLTGCQFCEPLRLHRNLQRSKCGDFEEERFRFS